MTNYMAICIIIHLDERRFPTSPTVCTHEKNCGNHSGIFVGFAVLVSPFVEMIGA
jgi:hypothetical protein